MLIRLLILRDEAFNIARNPKYDGYQREIASMFFGGFLIKTSGGAATLGNKSATKN